MENVPQETQEEETKPEAKKKVSPYVEAAREERLKMDEAAARMKIENDRREELMARNELGGISEAGESSKPKEETPREYAERVRKNDI